MDSLMHKEYVNRQGQVTDQTLETYYCKKDELRDDPRGRYLRLFGDIGSYDVELRVSYRELEELGWKKI